ncbi:MAG: phosphate ABC transporter permease subunit PstC, partial [Bradyrhizobium sp.]|nr:phosphate ABC transporter permease subunit PstC [Bradyrhizobium sp.]
MAVQTEVSDIAAAAGPYDRARALSAFKLGDVTFYWITRLAAISVLLILGGIIVSLIIGAWPAMKAYGFEFLWTRRWAPSADPPVLGALGPIYGTLVTSFIAMLIAIPVGLGIAIFLTELCPQWLRRPIGIAIELLAGIPSIIYGMWGFFVLGPFLAYNFQPFMISLCANIPVLQDIFAGPPSYLSLFNASLILAIMVLPFITAISVDVFKTVPPVLKEAAYGVGCTTWEVVRSVVIPYTRVGVIGGIMLAIGLAFAVRMATTIARAEMLHDLLIEELNHRVKNTLAILQAIAVQTFRSASRFEREKFEGRLGALAEAHNLLSKEKWQGSELEDVIGRVLKPYRLNTPERIRITGPKVALSPRLAVVLSMIVHEIATNAAKYGALSNDTG